MKKILLSIVALCCTVVAGAQNEIMTAVLQHGDDVSVFKGANAFVNANAAAADGDVITLSAGAFNVATITKSISVYGAGFEKDEASGTEITKINAQLYLGTSGGETLTAVHLEGLYFSTHVSTNVPLDGFRMDKCYVNGNTNIGANTNTMIKNCVITGNIEGGNKLAENCIIENCYVGGNINTFNSDSNVKVDHLVLIMTVQFLPIQKEQLHITVSSGISIITIRTKMISKIVMLLIYVASSLMHKMLTTLLLEPLRFNNLIYGLEPTVRR